MLQCDLERKNIGKVKREELVENIKRHDLGKA